MVRRKKKAWGPSNALWRYIHGDKGRKTRRRKGGYMAKRKFGRRSSGGGGRGFAPLGMLAAGAVGSMLIGMSASMIGKRVIGSPMGAWSGPLYGMLVGGPVGALGALGADMFLGSGSSASTTAPELNG